MTQQATTQATTRPSARPAAEILAQELAQPSLLQSPDMTKQWWPQSLAGGAAGIAMLHIERARTGLSTWDAARAWLKAVTSSDIQAGAPGGLFEGGPAVAFTVNAAADVPGKYAQVIASLDGYVTLLTRRRLRAAHSRIADGELAAFTEYDVIYGLTGIGSYLLRREQHHDLLRDVLSYLVALTRPLRFGGQTVPGWWTRAAPTGQPSPDLLTGHGNFGMAHGIAGPLALLALAMRQGVGVTGQAEAIGVICAWLDEWRQEGTNGPWWPERITDADVRDHQVHRAGPHRPSWCYGTPGLARAQQLAGHAIGDAGRQRLAERALAQCLADEAQLG
jgi:class I lanthipeptide synthase